MVDDRADLSNAIALTSAMANGSRIVAPSIGGAACVAGGLAFALWLPRFRALVRPIYIGRGIEGSPASRPAGV